MTYTETIPIIFNYKSCSGIGNVNGDTDDDGNDVWSVLDIVALANCVLNDNCQDIQFSCAADVNEDGGWNVLDVVVLANCVLADSCGG